MGFNTASQSIGQGNKSNSTQLYYIGIVTDVYVDGTKRIKVRVQGIDDGLDVKDIPDAFPLLPKYYSITPKIDEKVFVFMSNTNDMINDRLYVGPIVSQPQYLQHSSIMTATSALNSGKTPLGMDPNKIPSARGVFIEGEDVLIEGRVNADIVFKENEILLRTGKYSDEKIEGIPILNTKNPTYIQLKHNVSLYGSDTKFSVMNLVSDKINLITNSGDGKLSDPDKQINDDELVKILSEAHPIPYGDLLVEYLKLLKDALVNHAHPYNGMKGEDLNGAATLAKLNSFDLTSLLSKNIKIK